MSALIRPATEADLPAILDITNHAILHTTALWYDDPLTLENRRQWFLERTAKNFPILVAQIENHIAAFASYGPFRPQPGYNHTVEHSLYVAPPFHRQGLATHLFEKLLTSARAQNIHALIACIDADNLPSIHFHQKHAFHAVGLLPQVGKKFHQWQDLLIMQRTLP